jgi:polar amino acid transport system permease protein
MQWCEAPGHLLGNEALIRYGCRMVSGLWVTMLLVAISVPLGFVLGIGLAVARGSSNAVIRGASKAYVTFFRGTPLLVQLFLIYYGGGQIRGVLDGIGVWWFFREAIYCALFSFTLNTAAYQAEALRGAIQSLPKGQVEAGKALGLSRWPIFWKIVFPQALIVALRPLGNELIVMIKASAVASLVTILDLMGQTRIAFARSFDFTVYAMAAFIYLMLTETVRRIWNRLEAYLSRHLRHRASARQQNVEPGATVRV